MTEILLIFLLPLTFIFAGLYFLSLRRFGNCLRSHHPDSWRRLVSTIEIPRTTIQITYVALRESKAGRLFDVKLDGEVMQARRRTVTLLYLGLFSFIVLLSCVIWP
jgi:uncharacterized membrane protein YqjE